MKGCRLLNLWVPSRITGPIQAAAISGYRPLGNSRTILMPGNVSLSLRCVAVAPVSPGRCIRRCSNTRTLACIPLTGCLRRPSSYKLALLHGSNTYATVCQPYYLHINHMALRLQYTSCARAMVEIKMDTCDPCRSCYSVPRCY